MLLGQVNKRNLILIMVGLMLSVLLSGLDSTIVGTAMPRVIGDLQGMNLYSWPFTAYMLCSTIAIIIFGKISDTHGRKPIFLVGIIIFLLGSVLCGFSQSMLQLIIFRGFQGIGGGVLITIAYTIVGDLVSIRERGKYAGVLSSMFGLASLIGPAVGGFITDNLNWRWVFYVNVPLGLIAIFTIISVLPYYKRTQEGRIIDYKGAAVLTLALIPLILAFVWGNNSYPWLSAQIIGMLILASLLLVVFIWVERRAKEPILPPGIFRNSVLSLSIIISFLVNAVMFCSTIYIPLFMQGVAGTSATSSGFILTPCMVGMSIASFVSGVLISRTGRYKGLAIAAFFFMISGIYLLHTMTVEISITRALAYSALVGIGCGMSFPVFTIAVQNVFPRNQLGMVTSTLQFFRNMGATIGVAIFGSIMVFGMNNGLAGLDLTGSPPQIASLINNPRFLTSPETMGQIQAQIPSGAFPVVDQILQQIKVVLASSLDMVFLAGTVIAGLALVLTLFVKELPLVSVTPDTQRRATNEKITNLES